MSFKTRTAFYSLALAFGVFQTIFAVMDAILRPDGPYMQIFEGIATGWAVLTWVWVSVLLAFNNRPLSSRVLVRSSAHFISFIIFAVGWLALIIMLGTQLPSQCDFETYSDGLVYVWCPLGATSFGCAILLCMFCFGAATVVYLSARKTDAGLSANVAYNDVHGHKIISSSA